MIPSHIPALSTSNGERISRNIFSRIEPLNRRADNVGQASRLPWPRSGQRRTRQLRRADETPATGVWTCWAGVFPLPEGDSRIARQFTAGFGCDIPHVPKGRMNPSNVMSLFILPFLWRKFSRPFGTCCHLSKIPPLKRCAILNSPFGRRQTHNCPG